LDPADPEERKTIDRQFFESWASVWRQLIRPEAAITRVSTDPHSPNEFRANQVAKHLDAFHEAYATKPGDDMWLEPAQRVTIWDLSFASCYLVETQTWRVLRYRMSRQGWLHTA